jgi:DUF971 family protein
MLLAAPAPLLYDRGVADDALRIDKLTQVGRYALGVQWGDGHDSILPHRNVRRACPCEACVASPGMEAASDEPVLVDVLGGQSVFIRWADGHETLVLLSELRALCRCARCAGEPDYPISGR